MPPPVSERAERITRDVPITSYVAPPCAARTAQRVGFATPRRAILPLPKGEGRGEGEATLETPMRLAAYPGRF